MEDGRFVAQADQLPQDELADHLDPCFVPGVKYSALPFYAKMRVVSSAGTRKIPQNNCNIYLTIIPPDSNSVVLDR